MSPRSTRFMSQREFVEAWLGELFPDATPERLEHLKLRLVQMMAEER